MKSYADLSPVFRLPGTTRKMYYVRALLWNGPGARITTLKTGCTPTLEEAKDVGVFVIHEYSNTINAKPTSILQSQKPWVGSHDLNNIIEDQAFVVAYWDTIETYIRVVVTETDHNIFTCRDYTCFCKKPFFGGVRGKARRERWGRKLRFSNYRAPSKSITMHHDYTYEADPVPGETRTKVPPFFRRQQQTRA